MIGDQIIHLNSVDSTNNYVANIVSEGKARHGMVILADTQTNGRGQRGANWQSEPFKNLLFSIYLEHSSLAIVKQESLTHFVSLAIHDYLNKIGIQSSIKWPNDIVIYKKKIAGILIENQLRGENIKSSIIGIGFNVLQTEFSTQNSTSILMETKNNVSLKIVLQELMIYLNFYYTQIIKKEYQSLKNKYIEKLWLINEESDFEINNNQIRGVIRGTDEFGRLQIEHDKLIHLYELKEVKFNLRNEL